MDKRGVGSLSKNKAEMAEILQERQSDFTIVLYVVVKVEIIISVVII
jgi:hypothetical protein